LVPECTRLGHHQLQQQQACREQPGSREDGGWSDTSNLGTLERWQRRAGGGGRGDSGGTRGATAPPAPSHASSRAGRPPASASGGGQTGGIGGAPEHGGERGRNPRCRRCSAWPLEKEAGKSERWRGRSAGAGPLRPTAAVGVNGARQSQTGRWRGCRDEQKRAEGGEVVVVGRFDRSVDRTELVWLRPAGRPGQNGPARPNGLWPV
jgi:hypothetical protein